MLEVESNAQLEVISLPLSKCKYSTDGEVHGVMWPVVDTEMLVKAIPMNGKHGSAELRGRDSTIIVSLGSSKTSCNTFTFT